MIKSVLAVALTAVVATVLACGASSQQVAISAAAQADVAAYAAEQLACVAGADGSLAAANACLAAVEQRWCGDGGQLAGYCAGQTPPDAGGQ
jgi:hypothetical protein